MYYRIVLQGHVADGRNQAEVRHQFSRVTGLPPGVTAQMFGSTPNVIKRQLPRADAERIAATLRAIGASVTLEPDYQGPSAGGLDPVTLPAIPNFGPIGLPPEPAAAPPPSRGSRALRKLGQWALPVLGVGLIVAAALYFAPEFEAFVRKWRKAPEPPPMTVVRKAPIDAAPAQEASGPRADHVHGPWRCTNQTDGSSTYWIYRPDGTLAYVGDDMKHGDQPIAGPDVPTTWALDGDDLRLGGPGGAERALKIERLTLMQLEYRDPKGNATRCSRP